jgi:alpha-acetolactate decarboxylase
MREALKQGKSEGRVVLESVLTSSSFGVGALAGLEGEITIIEGQAFLATAPDQQLQVRQPSASDEATLLVLANVSQWHMQTLPACANYNELENAVAQAIVERGYALDQPTPFRVTGEASNVELHVIRGNCQIANPSGAKPWRWQSQQQNIDLIGFFAENSAGQLTHHTHRSHVHIVALEQSCSGHLDEITLKAGAFLWLPK